MNLLLATFPLAAGTFSDAAVSTTLDSASRVILYWVGNAVLYGSALALLTWALLSTALRRTRPTIHAAFWLLVIAKFLLPVGPGWSYSLSSLVSSVTGWPKPAPQAAAEPTSAAAVQTSSFTFFLLLAPDAATATAAPAATPAARPPAPPSIAPSAVLVGLYLVGLVVIAWIRLAAYRKVARSVRKLPAADAATRDLVRNVCARIGQRRMLDVRISEAAPAPYVLGAWRPMLVLSTRNLVSREECEAVVLHELAHLRRHDLLVRYAQWLAGTVLYFWPVVAWVNRRIDLAREAACDEWALRHGRLSPAEYARCLLKCAQPVRSGLTAYAPAAMAANATHVERRIEMILDTQTTPRRSRMLALLGGAALCGWTGFALSGASAALPSKPAEDANKTSPAPWWQARQNGALSFFLPQLADSLNDVDGDATDNVMYFSPGVDDLPGPHQCLLDALMAAHGGTPEGVSGQWVAANRSIALQGAVTAVGQPQVFMMTQGGQLPGVDLDGDGAVSADEHDAYMLTLAMRDPAATLAKYPKADENGDGTLSADEASAFLSGGFMGSGEPAMFKMAAPDGATPAQGMFEIKLDGADAAGMSDLKTHIALAFKHAGDEAAASADGMVHELVVKALADAGASADRTYTVMTDVKCDDANIQLHPNVQMLDGDKMNVVFEAIGEKYDADTAGTAAPKGMRVLKKVITQPGDDGQPVTTITEQNGDEEPKVVVMRGGVDLQLGDAQSSDVPVLSKLPVLSRMFTGAAVEMQEPPAVWLLQNAGEGPSADDVRKFAGAASDASLKRFLKMHPKSDANKDGALTVQERDAYLEKMQSHSLQRLLKRFPHADANGDGILTSEEKREFFKNRKQADATGDQHEIEIHGSGDDRSGVWMRIESDDVIAEPTVKVIKAGEPNEGPR
jgi:beta-lactamase regulating signal transducer with metallopeptidase domain